LKSDEPTALAVEDIETALVRALAEASAAGRFDVVALLAGELRARRLASQGVASIYARRREPGA
jgi:hypothetical protein